jgi:hypothetical protein
MMGKGYAQAATVATRKTPAAKPASLIPWLFLRTGWYDP